MGTFPLLPDPVAERGKTLRAWCDGERERWQGLHRQGAPALQVAAGLADSMQQALAALFNKALTDVGLSAPPMALVALGGLGRREFAPYSDVDVAVVCDTPKSEAAHDAADGVFYPLWDARLEVGHAVRSVDDFVAITQQDDTARTAALDCRFLAGDEALFKTLSQRLRQGQTSSASRRYATSALRQWLEGGNAGTVYLLQPDIKTGPGGLREIHRLWWLARLLWKIDSWHDLLSIGLLDRHGLDTISAGRASLLNLRLAMHFVSGRRQDQLRFELQDDVAAYLAVPAGPGQRAAADNLLETFYRHAKAVRAVSTRMLERCAENVAPRQARPPVRQVEGFDLFAGCLTLRRVDQFDAQPLDLLRIFRVAQRERVRIYVHARGCIAAAAPRLIDAAYRADNKAARLFVDIITDPERGAESLELLHELGVLECYVPEFVHVTGLAQRDLYHVHTVDAHLVACARRAQALLAGRDAEAPADIAAAALRIARPHVLVLGALMHDIGKGHGHGHSERGAVMARDAGTRLSLAEEDVADVEFLVLEHLSMFRISQRRDLEDEQLIAKFAGTVGSMERLDLLYVLSYADAVTTGPEAWTDWKGTLLRELYQRARHAMRGHAVQQAMQNTLAQQRAARLAEIAAMAPSRLAAMQRLAERLVPRHLAAHRASLLLRHLDAVDVAGRDGVCCSIAVDERRGGWEVVLVGSDRAGLVADLSGVLAAWGVSVDAAHISGTTDGLVIDTFVIRSGSRVFDDPARVQALSDELRDALRGEKRFAARMAERLRAEALRSTGVPRSQPRVLYDLEAQSDATVADVFAPDRVGLLHDIAHAIFQTGASIVLARVVTEGERAVDAFYLVNAQTGAPLSAEERDAVADAITQAARPGARLHMNSRVPEKS